jgi:hypothetical protein
MISVPESAPVCVKAGRDMGQLSAKNLPRGQFLSVEAVAGPQGREMAR